MATTEKTFHGLKLLARCGGGAYGDVYYCEDVSGERMTLKVIDKKRLGAAWERELQGVKNYRRITGGAPNLLRILLVGEDEESFYYTMEAADSVSPDEYLPDTLAQRLQSGPLPPEQLYPVLRGVFEGIKTIHAAGFAHRDIKPDNIIFVNGVPKLCDIGLLSSFSNSVTALAGTLEFLPPEVRAADSPNSSDRASRRRSDLYAFGKVVYCAATGLEPGNFPTVPTREKLSPALKQFLALAFALCDRDEKTRLTELAELEKILDAIPEKIRRGKSPKILLPAGSPLGKIGKRLLWALRSPGVRRAAAVALGVVAAGYLLVSALDRFPKLRDLLPGKPTPPAAKTDRRTPEAPGAKPEAPQPRTSPPVTPKPEPKPLDEKAKTPPPAKKPVRRQSGRISGGSARGKADAAASRSRRGGRSGRDEKNTQRKMLEWMLGNASYRELAQDRLAELEATEALRKAGKYDAGDDPSRALEEKLWRDAAILYDRNQPAWTYYLTRIEQLRKDRQTFEAAHPASGGQDAEKPVMPELAAHLGWERYRTLLRSERYGKLIAAHEAESAAERKLRKSGAAVPEPASDVILEKKLWKNLNHVLSYSQVPYILEHIEYVREHRGKDPKPPEVGGDVKRLVSKKLKCEMPIPRNWVVASPSDLADAGFSPDRLNESQKKIFQRTRYVGGFRVGFTIIFCDEDEEWRDMLCMFQFEGSGGALFRDSKLTGNKKRTRFAERCCVIEINPADVMRDPDVKLRDLQCAVYLLDDGNTCISISLYAKKTTFSQRLKELEASLRAMKFFP